MDILELKNYLNCDNAFLTSLIQKFIDEVTEIIETIEKAATEKKWETVKLNAHKMLSSVRIFEVEDLINLLEKIEIDADDMHAKKNEFLPDQRIEELTRNIKELRTLTEKTISSMELSLEELQ